MEQNCLEQMLNDVVQVDLVPASVCMMSVPSQVAGMVTMTEAQGMIGAAALTVAMDASGDVTGEMEDGPQLKQQEKREAAGTVVTHELQIAVTGGFEGIRTAVSSLSGVDFNVVMTTDGGERYLLYGLPNASEVLLTETDVNKTSTLKVTMESMSHVIRLT